MNVNNDTPETPVAIEPLDAFERRWVDALQQDDADLAPSEVDFVRGVLDRFEPVTERPVLARIGWLPYAVAAAVLIAGAVGWAVFFTGSPNNTPAPIASDDAATPPADDVAEQPVAPVVAQNDGPDERVAPQRPQLSEAERRAMAQQLQLGTMIADTSTTFSQPAAGLPKAISNTADSLTLKALTNGFVNPVPDPAEVLPPRRDRPRG